LDVPQVRKKCHAKGQKFKLLNIKVWKMVSLLSFVRYEPSLLRTFNCWDAFLHKLLGFLFPSEFFFRTTQELEYFFLSRKARIFFPEFNIRLCDKKNFNW
jgi:hypothetical protein